MLHRRAKAEIQILASVDANGLEKYLRAKIVQRSTRLSRM